MDVIGFLSDLNSVEYRLTEMVTKVREGRITEERVLTEIVVIISYLELACAELEKNAEKDHATPDT